MNAALRRDDLLATGLFSLSVFLGIAFFGNATQSLPRLLLAGAFGGLLLGFLNGRATGLLFFVLLVPVFLVSGYAAMRMRGLFDPDYGSHFMYEDMSWLPLILLFGGLPMGAIFIGANFLTVRLSRTLRR